MTETCRAPSEHPGRGTDVAAGRRRRPAIWPALLATLAVVAGCRPAPPPATRPNVFVFLVDTLRADRLGAYGGTRGLTPFLDSLAGRAVVFQHAYAQSSWTAPSVAALFTSRYQSQTGVLEFGAPLEPGETTIAEVMHDAGYATAAFLANPGMPEQRGYAQGFDTYQCRWPGVDDVISQKARGDVIGAKALAWLDALPKGDARPPVFVYLHYLEPHIPFTPPDAILDRLAATRPRGDVPAAFAALFFQRATGPPDLDGLRNVETVYDAEVMSVDETIRDTFAALSMRHLLDDAIVVFTADHGEELEDHGYLGHGDSLYEEVIHVPLLIARTTRTTRLDVGRPVALIDVAPTIADFAGAAVPSAFEGRSLRALVDPAPAPSWWRRLVQTEPGPEPVRPVFSELLASEGPPMTDHQRAVILDRKKLIVGRGGETEEYDLARDPAETSVITTADPELARLVDGMRTRVAAAAAKRQPLPPGLSERLKALGYLQ